MIIVLKRNASNRILPVLALIIGLAACARIVTDSVGEDTSDETAGADMVMVCEPECPEGQECLDGWCRELDAEGFGGWFRPGPDSGAEMVRIPGGEFWMGCDEGTEPECAPASRPRVSVHLTSPYSLDRFEVTNARYREYLNAEGITASKPTCNGYDLWDDSNPQDPVVPDWAWQHPVACVSAADAAAFCAWAGKALPTEAQWELGARGQTGRVYPWGDDFHQEKAQCYRDWDASNPDWSLMCKDIYASVPVCNGGGTVGQDRCEATAPVMDGGGAPLPQVGNLAWGLRHMSGNVAEWVADAWTENHEGCETDGVLGCTDPYLPPDQGGLRPVRGGSWFQQGSTQITGWFRESEDAGKKKKDIGFRCAWNPGR
ncbi:MAG: formylglycine-generating enzyme family protein [Pseudomonadota bacterium]